MSFRSGCKISIILCITFSISKEKASFLENQKIWSNVNKYENQHQQKLCKRQIFVLNFGFSSGPPLSRIKTNTAKTTLDKNGWTRPFTKLSRNLLWIPVEKWILCEKTCESIFVISLLSARNINWKCFWDMTIFALLQDCTEGQLLKCWRFDFSSPLKLCF